MSWARREFFGSKIKEFEAEFKRGLLAISKQGEFTNDVIFEGFFLYK
jgi:hypothetical protein